MNIVSVEVENGLFIRILLALSEGIFAINPKNSQTFPVFKSPCGFPSVQAAKKISDSEYLITNADGRKCLCSQELKNCRLITESQAYSLLSQDNNDKYGHESPFNAYLSTVPNMMLGSTEPENRIEIKKNLYGLLKKGYLVSILVNNSVLVTDLKQKRIVDRVDN